MLRCPVPFADSPHITQEGFIIHGSNPETRAKVYRLLLHREIISNPREAAQEVLVHLRWIREDGTPIQVFPFTALQYLEHRPTLPPAKRRAVLWLAPQPEGPLAPRPSPQFQMYHRPPAGRAGILGRPTLATLESTAFLALGFGAVNGQDFPTRRDPLSRFTLFLISQLVSGSRVSLTQGRAGPAGVETAGREHGSCNHAVGE